MEEMMAEKTEQETREEEEAREKKNENDIKAAEARQLASQGGLTFEEQQEQIAKHNEEQQEGKGDKALEDLGRKVSEIAQKAKDARDKRPVGDSDQDRKGLREIASQVISAVQQCIDENPDVDPGYGKPEKPARPEQGPIGGKPGRPSNELPTPPPSGSPGQGDRLPRPDQGLPGQPGRPENKPNPPVEPKGR